MRHFTYPIGNGRRLFRPLIVLMALLACHGYAWAETVVDAENKVIYDVIDAENKLVEISSQQSMGSYYDVFTIPATVTQMNPDSNNYGQTYTIVGMQPGAFQYAGITGIIIEADIPVIPENAFYCCYSLKTVQLPPNIERVDNFAFYNCSKLTGIAFTDKLVSIGKYAFRYCGDMSTVDLSTSVNLTTIDEYAYSGCGSMAFPELNPSGVLYINKEAFSSCYALGTVTLPRDCHIGMSAFLSSTITELNIPSEGGNVFYYTVDNLLYPATNAFKWSTLPEKIVLPANVDYVPALFDNAYELKSVEIKAENVVLSGACFRNIYALKEVIWPSKVKEIGSNCFENTGLESVTIPPCDNLGYQAFQKNSYLKQIVWPDTEIANINSYLFSECTALEEVSLPDWMTDIKSYMFNKCSSLKTVHWPSELIHIWEGAFMNTVLEFEDNGQPSFPDKLESILFYAFQDVPTLGKVKFPTSLKWIGMNTFKNCSSLQLVDFDSLTSLTMIDQGAFMNCTSIEGELILPPNLKTLGTSDKFIPGGGTGISRNQLADGVFQNCTGLKKVTLNPGVSIGSDCFCQSGLEEVVFPAAPCEPVVLKSAAFRFAEKMTAVDLPGYIVLPQEAFYWCSELVSVNFGEGITATGDRAFMNCTKLNYLTFPSTLEVVTQGSFAFCPIMNVHSFPESVKEIQQFAFWKGHNDGTLRLHKGLEKIATGAFIANSYDNIVWPEYTEEEIASRLSRPDFADYSLPIKIDDDVFANNKFVDLSLPTWMKEVPNGLCRQETDRSAYKFQVGSWYWPHSKYTEDYEDRSEYLRTITFPEGIEAIGAKAFYNNTMVAIGRFPSTITEFGSSCFENGGKKLTTEDVEQEDGTTVKTELYLGSLYCPDGTDFGTNAFANAKIEKIIFEGCATFHFGAFSGMKYITEIDFPECMEEIPEAFCKEWSVLTRVGFKGNHIRVIGHSAFMNCPKLTDFPDLKDMKDLEYIGDYAFYNSKLPTAVFDFSAMSKLYYIGDYAFALQSATEIKWPDVETLKLGKNAFFRCQNLASVTIPKSVYNINDGCFAQCSKLAKVEFEPRVDTKAITIGGYAFATDALLPEISLPDVDVTIGRSAFRACNSLVTVNWPETESRKTSIGISAFYSCRKLNIKELHPQIKELPDSVFMLTTAMETLHMPRVSKVGSYAFFSSSIQELRFDCLSGFTSFSNYSIYNAQKLKRVSMRIAPTSMGEATFQQCYSLEEFVVDDTEAQKTKYLQEKTFYQCKALKYVSDIFDGFAGQIYQRPFVQTSVLRHVALPGYFKNYNISTKYVSGFGSSTPEPINLSRFYQCSALSSTVKYVARLYVQKPDDSTQYALAEAETPALYADVPTGMDGPLDKVPAELLQEILETGKLFSMKGMSITVPAKGETFIAVYAGKVYKLLMP